MLEIASLNFRKFDLKINGKELHLLPPKLKHLQAINEVAKKMQNGENDVNMVSEILSVILSRNDANKVYEPEWISANVDMDEASIFIDEYIDWIGEVQADPNSKSLIARRKRQAMRG